MLKRSHAVTASAIAALGLIAVAVLAVATVDAFAGRGDDRVTIVGGQDAEPGAWPWQVAILARESEDDGRSFRCGGTLVDREWVLTAAHCAMRQSTGDGVLPATAFQVVVGMHSTVESDGVRVDVAQVVSHADFGQNFGFENDIALMRLAEPATIGERVQVVGLLDDQSDPAVSPGQHGTVTGWGQTDPNVGSLAEVLQQALVPIVDCRQIGLPLPSYVCTSGREGTDTCHGDSGGPLVVETDAGWRQAGVTSVGLFGPCGQPDSVTAFTSVASFTGWVQDVISDTRPMMERGVRAPMSIPSAAEFDYEVRVSNTGRIDATDLVVTNAIPDGVAFVAGSVTPSKGELTWDVGSIGPGDVFTATYRVREVGSNVDSVSGHAGVSPQLRLPEQQRGRQTLRQPGLQADRQPKRQPPPANQPERHALPERQAGGQPPPPPLVIGGQDAEPGAWPWQAAIYVTDMLGENFACGGSLIDDRWVLTAAHCLQGIMTQQPLTPDQVEVRLGVTRLGDRSAQVRGARQLFTNGGWHVGLLTDIGLIELDSPVEFDASVRPVALTGIEDDDYLLGGAWGTVTGWGLTSMDDTEPAAVLQQVGLEIMDAESCLAHAPAGNEICAGPAEGGRSACFGDSGGPFVVEHDGSFVLVGIVSSGTSQQCGAPDNYSLFTRASLYHEWIAHKLATGQQDKIIVNDDLAVAGAGAGDLIEAGLVPAKTLVEIDFDGPLPTPWPPEPSKPTIHLPYVTSG